MEWELGGRDRLVDGGAVGGEAVDCGWVEVQRRLRRRFG